MTRALICLSVSFIIVACSDDGIQFEEAEPNSVALSVSFAQPKIFQFEWTDTQRATHYRLLEDIDGMSGFTQVGEDIPQGVESYKHTVPLYLRANARYILQSCNPVGCNDSDTMSISGPLTDSIGYFKAANPSSGARLGESISLSKDGKTLAVAAQFESISASDEGGGAGDGDSMFSGAVYVYTLDDEGWTQVAHLRASNSDAGDFFGASLDLSDDGTTLAVGAPLEDSNAKGVNGDQSDNSLRSAGAVYLFRLAGTSWEQQAYLKAHNSREGYGFGNSVSLSEDGSTLAIGSTGESSNADGVHTVQFGNSFNASGAVYVFKRTSESWLQHAYLKASNVSLDDVFGSIVSLSSDGSTLAVSAWNEDSDADGVGGDSSDDSAESSGAVYAFDLIDDQWTETAYIKAHNSDRRDYFGDRLSLSGDGNTLAVGAIGEQSQAVGVNGDADDNSLLFSGAVYVFSRNGRGWEQQAYIKASNNRSEIGFGRGVSLNYDGNTLAVGGRAEDGSDRGLGGDQSDEGADAAGAAYLFTRSNSNWRQLAYIKSSNTERGDLFGRGISLSSDGWTLAVGAPGEDGANGGINADQNDNNSESSGAVYLY